VCGSEFNGATDGRRHREAEECAVQTFQCSPISKRRVATGREREGETKRERERERDREKERRERERKRKRGA